MKLLINGVDPGVRTGVAFGCFDESAILGADMATILHTGDWETWTTDQRRGAKLEMKTAEEIVASAYLRHGLQQCERTIVGIEDFILRKTVNTGPDVLAPVRVTSHLEACYSRYAGVRVYKFSASSAKNICSDKRLKHWGGWVKGKEHERDAVRIMIMAMRQVRIDMERISSRA